MGSNMAEAHPVAFANVVKAKELGAQVMHVDPHYSRTSALANLYVPTRAGSDIVFLGAIIRHVLETSGYFHDYVVQYTNAATLVREDFKDTEELDGLFSGYDPASETYTDQKSWDYQRDKNGQPLSDPTLQHPQCVFQIMRRHFARYTPEMVENVCGVPREVWLQVAQTLIENSGRERTSAICYAVGWTQQSKGVQIIRAAAILQLLLGNIGRPGGGIMALRGHASIQGSTDVPTLYDLLAGYMPQPSALLTPVPAAEHSPGATTWGEKRDAPSNVLSQQTLQEYIDSSGQKLGWWSHTQAYMRSLLQAWYGDAANEEEGNCSYRWIPKIIGDHSHLATSYTMLDGTVKGYLLFGQKPEEGSRITNEPDALLVLKEINGYYTRPPDQHGAGSNQQQTYTLRNAPHVPNFTVLKSDGGTACGAWIYSGVYPEPGRNRAASRNPEGRTFLEWGFTWPANRRILYNRASADAQGRPWSERKKYVWWDEAEKKWTGYDIPDFPLSKSPDFRPEPGAVGMDAHAGTDPFIMKPDGKGWLFAPKGLKDGPLPTHYEAAESPMQNALYHQQSNPAAKYFRDRPDNRLSPVGDPNYPIVITTYRLTEHHVSGPMTRWMPWLNALQPSLFAEISPELAAERKIRHGDWVIISTPRGEIEALAMVTRRMRPLYFGRRVVHQIGLPFHWGFQSKSTGSITNDLAHMVLEPNVSIEEAKAFTCNIRPGRMP